MKSLSAWQMLEDTQIVSQFDRNYAGDVNAKNVEESIGITYHTVNNIHIYIYDQI